MNTLKTVLQNISESDEKVIDKTSEYIIKSLKAEHGNLLQQINQLEQRLKLAASAIDNGDLDALRVILFSYINKSNDGYSEITKEFEAVRLRSHST